MLKRMKRMYTTADYMRFVERARDAIPDIAIASDFIVGFPGETESEFQATVAMIHEVGFSQSFVFKYSERPGTPSSRLTDDVSEEEKKRRNNLLLAAQNQVSERLLKAKIGQDVEVLINGPSKKDPSRPSGRSGDHRIVILDSGSDVVVVVAAGEGALEFAGKCLGGGMAHCEPNVCGHISRGVKDFRGADPSSGGAHHVSYHIAAGLAGTQARSSQ